MSSNNRQLVINNSLCECFDIAHCGQSWVIFYCIVIWNVSIRLRMHQSLNDMQRVIQDSAHFLLTSDKSHHTSPDPVLPPLKFVCPLHPTEYDLYWALLYIEYNLHKFIRAVFNWVLWNPNLRSHSGKSERTQTVQQNNKTQRDCM